MGCKNASVLFERQLSIKCVNGVANLETRNLNFRKVGSFTNSTISTDSLGRRSIGDSCLKCIRD